MNFVRILLVIAAVALLMTGAAVYWFYSSLTSPIEHSRSEEYISIERGSTPSQIVGILASNGIIRNPTALRLYLRTFGDASKLQAGDYRFPSPISPLQALKELEKGSIQVKRLTIPEGFTRFDIAKRIATLFPQDPPLTEDQIVLLMSDTSLIRDIAPEARNLEGYLYPSTYDLAPDAEAEDIVRLMVEQFRKVWKPEWTERAKQMGRTPHEIVTLASLIETESPLESERPVVASVIYNRLKKNIPLGIDQTAVYIAKMERRWDGTIHRSDLESTSPYNTRKYGGIPPGPIASVSVGSIEAALNPIESDYIFYVLNVERNDGSHHFYASASDFERGKAVYQRWLEEQRRLKRENELAQ